MSEDEGKDEKEQSNDEGPDGTAPETPVVAEPGTCTPFVEVNPLEKKEKGKSGPEGAVGNEKESTTESSARSEDSKEPKSKNEKENGVKYSKHSSNNDSCESSLRAICVALKPFQPPMKLQANDPSEFIPHLKDTSLVWVNYRVKSIDRDALKGAVPLGFSTNLIESLLKNRQSGYEDRESEMGLILPAVKVDGLKVKVYRLMILMKDSLVLTIHGDEVVRLVKFARYAEVFMRKIPVNIPMRDKLTLLLERIIDENNEVNFEGIRTIEEESDEVGKMLSDPKTPMMKLSPMIYEMKHALISYLNLLWDSQNVIHSLRYGDPELLSDDPDILDKFEVLSDDVTRHIQLGENLSEVLASGLEVLQGLYNNQLQIINNKMALVLTWMTIIGTALLVPNTIATAMGNTAYNLQPKDWWWYSILIIFSAVVSTWVSWYFLKKKGLLPKSIE